MISVGCIDFVPAEKAKQPDARARARILSATVLRRKNHPDLHPTSVTVAPRESTLFVYPFPKIDPIVLEDERVEFITTATPVRIVVEFSLKKMVFDGRLAL